MGSIGPDKVRELALGLEATGRPFLWALKRDASWRAGLPDGFEDRVAGRGKLVDWAPQQDVLRHAAVGCYLTHCGWNSTLEAIQHGVRLLCYPRPHGYGIMPHQHEKPTWRGMDLSDTTYRVYGPKKPL